MSAEMLLSKLQNIRRSGDGWRADCPNGHNHARGSLSITQAQDGRVLLCCFACHDTHGILSAVGLELADLFPERIRDPSPEARQRAREAFKRNAWAAGIRVLAREASVVLATAGMLRRGHALTANDCDRLSLSIQRIEGVRGLLG